MTHLMDYEHCFLMFLNAFTLHRSFPFLLSSTIMKLLSLFLLMLGVFSFLMGFHFCSQ